MQTLTQSGALWELHAWKNSFALAARFQAQRLKQVRRAIRRQRLVIFRLRFQRFRFSAFQRFALCPPRAFLDVNRACTGVLLRLGLDPIQHGDIIERFPSGKRRTAPQVVRIKRADLSRTKRNLSLVTCHSSLPR